MSAEIYNFFELSNNFTLKPEAAIRHFQSKGLKASFSWLDMIGEENDAAFTVAKMMDNDLLAYVDKAVLKAADQGMTLADFKKELMPKLQKSGWWGKKDVIDPLTGKVVKAQLGSASRLENIFRTNLQSAYAVGQWQSIEADKKTAPFLMYDAVEDHRVRPEHLQWNGTIREVDDEFWQTHYPPNGWQCRCGVIQLDRDELKQHGLKPSPKPKLKKRKWTNPRTSKTRYVPESLDPGWDHNPGKRRMEYLRQTKQEKAALLTLAQQKANGVSDKATAKAQKAYMAQQAANKALKKLGQAEVDGSFARQKAKTIERAAQHQLDVAIAENIPYLANAIKQLNKQKGSAGLSAKQLLDKAKDKASKIEQSVLLNQYKKAQVDGKKPSAKAQSIYDDLPEEAQKAIDDAIELKTGQYQARASLKNIKDNPKGQTLKHQILTKLEKSGEAKKLTPTQLLKKVEDNYLVEQKKKETAAKLSGYKKKLLEGKLPTPGQQAAFNTLDDEAKEKFLKKVDGAKNKSVEKPGNKSDVFYHAGADIDTEKLNPLTFFTTDKKAAQSYHANKKGSTKLHQTELDIKKPADSETVINTAKKMGYTPDDVGMGDWDDIAGFEFLSPHLFGDTSLLLKELKKKGYDSAHFATDFAIDGSGIKGGSWVVFDSKQIKAITKTKKKSTSNPAAAPTPQPKVIEAKPEAPQWKDLTKIGNQKGSNPGGIYQDTSTGKKYYIKEPASEDIARNEVLAAKLYEAAGVEVPNIHLMKDGKTVRIASEIIEDLQQDGAKLGTGKVQGVNENFMVDAWLSNWDVAGLGYDNLLIKGNRAIHIDVGGALRYRAQGGLKGDAFSKEVLEIESLRDSGMNPQSAAVFASATKDDMITGARKVLALDKQQITELVDAFGPTTKRERTKLINKLVARQKDIAKRYPEAVKAPNPELPTNSPITRLEYEQVKNSRSNGYTIATDKGDIEDQNVLLYHKKNLKGEDVTGGYFKLMPAAMRKLQRSIGEVADAKDPAVALHPLMTKAIKAVAHRADMGNGLDDYVFGYIDNAVEKFTEVRDQLYDDVAKKLRPKADLVDFEKRLLPFIQQLKETANKYSPGEVPAWNKSVGIYKEFDVEPAKVKKEKSALKWKKKKTNFNLSKFERGHQRQGEDKFKLHSHHYEAKINGAIVKFWPNESDSLFAMAGRIEIEVPGTRKIDNLKVFETIEKIGVNSQRANPLDIEELYLDKMAYIHKINKQLANETKGITDQKQRIKKKQELISKDLDIDLTSMKAYNPAGEYQAFGQGRRVHFRPEILNDPKIKQFEKNYRIFHANSDNGQIVDTVRNVLQSGGQMAATTDKIRRGIKPGGMSYTSDLSSGGANYFFTRIRKKDSAYNDVGFVWKSRQAARMDAISYNSDQYGRTTGNHVQQHRNVDLASIQNAHVHSLNETIFKDSLSLFDDLDRIVVYTHKEVEEVKAVLKKAGYDQWPDGRDLDDIIKIRGQP
ncbi:hypothetical protein ACH42_17145 [Endozoicomonas sp. (ex Bugula neritina AB1)]|nr:hypothetical protein ACH42_17145 [Endozoicomonas sp. (ex Bugula neritina AB1)]